MTTPETKTRNNQHGSDEASSSSNIGEQIHTEKTNAETTNAQKPNHAKKHRIRAALEKQARKNVFGISFIAAFGGLLYGYDTGVISGALPQMTKEWGLSSSVQEIVTTAILVGAVTGAILSGVCSRKLGRRRTIIIIAAVFLVGVLCSALSPTAFAIILSRLLLGLGVGGASQVIPTYIAEISPPERRGSLVTMFNIAIGVGILAANLVGALSHEQWSWRWMVGAAVIPAVILLFGMFRVPETPRWLMEQGEDNQSTAVLRVLRPTRPEAMDESDEIREVIDKQQEASSGSGWSNMRQRWTWPALIAALGVAAFTQLSGLEMMIYYAPTILQDTGFPAALSLWASVGIGVVYLAMTIIGRFIVDKVGRRGLMLRMIPGTIISLILFGGIFVVFNGHPPFALTIALLLLFMLFNSGGIQVVGWLIGSEMYPLSIRDQATSLHAAVLWGANIFVTSQALTWVHAFGMHGTMWIYAGFNIVALLFVIFLVPETKGRSLESIEDDLHKGTFRPFQVEKSK